MSGIKCSKKTYNRSQFIADALLFRYECSTSFDSYKSTTSPKFRHLNNRSRRTESTCREAQVGYQKRLTLEKLLSEIPVFGLELSLTDVYATIDAYSQGELMSDPLPQGTSARNMGKNDIWIAATAIFYDAELRTSDNDFDHLPAIGLRLVKV